MRGETGEGLVAPVREIDDARRLNVSPRVRIVRFQNVQAVAVEQEGVFPEQFLELRDGRVAVGKGLDFELIGGSRTCSEVSFIAQSFRLDPWCYRGCSRYVPPPRRWSRNGPSLVAGAGAMPGVPRNSFCAARFVNATTLANVSCKCTWQNPARGAGQARALRARDKRDAAGTRRLSISNSSVNNSPVQSSLNQATKLIMRVAPFHDSSGFLGVTSASNSTARSSITNACGPGSPISSPLMKVKGK